MLAYVQETFSELNAQILAQKTLINQFNGKFSDYDSKISQCESKMASLTTQLTTLQTTVNEGTQAFREMQMDIYANSQKLSLVEQKITDNTTMITKNL